MSGIWLDTDSPLGTVQPIVLGLFGNASWHPPEGAFALGSDVFRPRSAAPQIRPEIDVETMTFRSSNGAPAGIYVVRLYEDERVCSFSIGCLPSGWFGERRLAKFYAILPDILLRQGVRADFGRCPDKYLG
ncbi:hypothetical protein [Nocardia brasiliensis]|nr:hypothetical protein [Nocardia brasiliensis]